MGKLYVIDTSSLARLRPYNETSDYDLLVFPGILDALQILIDTRKLFSSLLVFKELENYYSDAGDEFLDWLNSNKEIFLPPTSSIQKHVKSVLSNFPKWIDVEKKSNDADPFVVATAIELNATVISEEKKILVQQNTKKIKIPNVCDHYNLESQNILTLLRNEDFKFIMSR